MKTKEIKKVEILDPYGFIYITTNRINGKKYIGQKIFSNGWKNYLGSGKILKQAVKKYGKENFTIEIIAITYSKEESNLLEIEFIKNHNAVESEDYYNITYGGEGCSMKGRKVSEDTKKLISLAQKGKVVSEKTRMKLSISQKGKILSKDTKIKISESHKGEKSYMFGKKKSKEIKEKMSISKKGEKNPNFNKKLSNEYRNNISLAQIKLNKEQVREIRIKYATSEYTQTELAKEYLVSYSVINNVVNFNGVYKNII